MTKQLPKIIGFTGLPGTGKDTITDYLVEAHGFTKYSFADPIKECLNARFGWSMANWQDREWKDQPNRLWGSRWDRQTSSYKAYSPREWAQWLGTEVGRDMFGQDCWVNVFRQRVTVTEGGLTKRWAIPDVRFENEAAIIRGLGGVIVHLVRDNIKPTNDHISNKGIASNMNDYKFSNNGTVQDLCTLLEEVLSIER